MNENNDTTTLVLPDAVREAAADIVRVFTSEAAAIEKAHGRAAKDIIAPAIRFAAAHDKLATDRGLVSKAGNIVDSRVATLLGGYGGEMLPSQSQTSRALRIGRNVAAGTAGATWERFVEASWSQPDEAVADGDDPVVVRNVQDVKTLAVWCEMVGSGKKDSKSHVLRDDVVIGVDRFAVLCAPPVVEVEDQDQEDADDSHEADPVEAAGAPVADVAIYGEVELTNVVNVGALRALFAACDNDTVEAAVTVDVSDFETVEALRELAVSALAAAELMVRQEALATA